MNGIEKITQRIQSDAQAEINAVLTQAREEAAQITARYEAQAQVETTELRAKNERSAAEREERLGTKELAAITRQVVELSREFQERWSQKSR